MKKFLKNYKYPLGITLSLISTFFIFQNGTCSQQATNSTTNSADTASNSTSTSSGSFSVSQSATSIGLSGTVVFTATGGTAPYYYTSISGGGTFANSAIGTFTAPNYASTCVVQVQDSAGNAQSLTVTVSSTASGALSISPLAPTVGLNGSLQFSASGGTAPYSFYVVGSNLGSFTSASSGLFTAGSTSGTTQVQVIDATNHTSMTTVSVSNSGSSGSSYKFVSASATSINSQGATWAPSNLIDGNTSTCYSSAAFSNATNNFAYASVTLTLGDAYTGAVGSFYTVDHLTLTSRSGSFNYNGFPLSYTIYYYDSSGTWQQIGTFSNQPTPGQSVTLNFQSVSTNQIKIGATYMTTDGSSNYYFQLCEVSH